MRLSDLDPGRVWHDMDPALFRRIASELFPVARTVAISCGAEPLCNPRFEDYLRRLYEADVPEREMVTNGLLLTPERSAAVLEVPPTSLFVSIDGAEPDTHAAIRGGCSLEVVVSNLRTFMQLRGSGRLPMLNFSTTLQTRNLKELPEIARLAAGLGAASLCVVPLVPYSGLDTSGDVPDMTSPEVLAILSEARSAAAGLGLAFSVSERSSRPASAPCPYAGSWVFVDPDGLVNPCPYWDISRPLGDLGRKSFREIWDGPEYRDLRSFRNSPCCRSCPEVEGTDRAEIVKAGPVPASREAVESHETGNPPHSPLP